MKKSKVYFSSDISPDGLIKIYDALGVKLKGNVAVKISTGEPGGHNFLNPKLIAPLVSKLSGTIVECLTAYDGGRMDPKKHWQTIKDHGFYDIAKCDILDEFKTTTLTVKNGKHLQGKNIVGEHILNYDSLLILSHFKGHVMAGFGGALKNMSIGLASTAGKAWIHSSGKTDSHVKMWAYFGHQSDFLESMAEACESVIDHFGKENILYISVANNLSVDCDCDAHPAAPEIADIGIFASTDPVALDQACYDAVINSDDPKKASLVNRMNSKNGIHVVEEAARLGLGSRDYEIVNID